MDAGRTRILSIAEKLLGQEVTRYAPARVEGSPVEYIINSGTNKVVVTVVNNSSTPWNGTIVIPRPSGSYQTQEWIADVNVPSSESGGTVRITGSVPAYDIKVYALTW